MHEVGLCQEIVAIAEARAAGARVLRIVVEVGKLAAVVPDALRFAFEVIAEGTSLEGAALELVEVDGRGGCRACGAEVVLSAPLGRCACGSTDLEWLSGDQLVVRRMEVLPCA